MNRKSLLNYLQYQQEIGGNELFFPDDFDIAGLTRQFKGTPKVPFSKDSLTKFVPVIPIEKDPTFNELQKFNLRQKAPQLTLPDFKSISEIFQFLYRENLYQINKGGVIESYPIVKSTGPEKPQICVVTMAPSKSDLDGEIILKGEDGELLTKMLNAININRKNVYCTSIVKNPDLNKKLYHTQKNIHLELVYRELFLTGCKFIMILGEKCAQLFLKTGKSMDDLREQRHELSKNNILNYAEIWVIEHPQKLIRSPGLKNQTWKDLKWIQTLI